MSVESKSKNLLNYITGSGGGWPSNTNIGVISGVDYIKQETTDNIYFNEMNNFTKISLILFMIIGRIEIIAVLFLIKKFVQKE